MAPAPQKIAELLQSHGYERETLGHETTWRLSSGRSDSVIRSKIEILERKEHFSLSKCNIQIDTKKILDHLEENAKKRFGKINSWHVSSGEQNCVQCILEIAPTKPPKKNEARLNSSEPGTVVGWTVHFGHAGTNLTLQLTNAFFIGAAIPDWWSKILHVMIDVLTPGHEGTWETKFLNEISIPLAAVPIALTNNNKNLQKNIVTDLSTLRIPTFLRIVNTEGKTIYDLTANPQFGSDTTPIDILEARETAVNWKSLDTKINQKKPIRSLASQTALHPMELLTRIGAAPALVNILDVNALSLNQNDRARSSTTTLVGAIVAAQARQHQYDVIALTSDLLRKIITIYGPVESISPLRNMTAEILGDYWSLVNRPMAIKSWNAALSNGRNPNRIYEKIARISREQNDQVGEFSALLKLCELERRRPQLENYMTRFIDLAHKDQKLINEIRPQYRAVLERALQTLTNNHNVIIALVKLMLQNDEHRKALSTLESYLSSPHLKLNPEIQSELHAQMALIWFENEKNNQLATVRYILATSPPSQPSQSVLNDAESFFIKTANQEQIRRILALRSGLTPNASNTETIERGIKYLASQKLYRDAIGNIINLISMGRTQQWYLDILDEAENDGEIDWVEVADVTLNADLKDLPLGSEPTWKHMAGRCALKNPETSKRGVATFCEKDVVPMLSPEEAQSVCHMLISENSLDKLTTFISARLQFSKIDETASHLTHIVNLNLQSSDGLFENAIAEFSLARDSNHLGEARAKKLIASKNLTTLTSLVNAHIAALAGRSGLQDFLDNALTHFILTQEKSLEPLIDQIIEARENQQAYLPIEKSELIKKLVKSGFVPLATELLISSINSGISCLDDEELAKSVLADDIVHLAKWLYLSANRADSKKLKKQHLTAAINLWLESDERPIELIDALTEVAKSQKISREKIALLENLCVREGKLQTFAETLERQISTYGPEAKSDLIHWAVRFTTSRMNDPARAAEIYQKWSKNQNHEQVADTIQDWFALGILYQAANNNQDSLRQFVQALSVPEILQHPEILLKSIEVIAKSKIDRTRLTALLQTLIVWSSTAPDGNLKYRLVEKSIDLHAASLEDLHRVFVANFLELGAERLATIAIQALAKAERQTNGITKILSEWQETRSIASHPEKWWDVIRIMTRSENLNLLRRSARCEVLYLYARCLFENESKRFDAIPHFESITHENPMDSRIWMPLYSLYEESGSRQKLIEHLERVIPLIERDKSLLEKTPFNIESLKNTLRRTRKASNLDPEKVSMQPLDSQKKSNKFEIQERAARMQRAWVDAIPMVRISDIAASAGIENLDSETGNSLENTPDEVSSSGAFDASAALDLSLNSYESRETTNTPANTPDLKLITNTRNSSIRNLMNWRDAVINDHSNAGDTKKVMTMAFASELEKHVAVQTIALMTGELAALENWHWPIWRKCETFEYSLSPNERIPEKSEMPLYGGQLHKLLRIISPMILRSNKNKFLVDARLAKLGIPQNTPSSQIDLAHPALARGNIRHFKAHLDKTKIRFFDTVGLGSEVFLDLGSRAIHFDAKWHLNLPPTILSHKILEHLANFQRGNAGVVELDPTFEIIPVINEIREVLSSSGISRLKIAFGIDFKATYDQLQSINREQLISLLTSSVRIDEEDIRNLQIEMRMKAYTTLLASTLDVIGLLEAINGKDLSEPGVLSPGKILSIHPHAKPILFLATKLRL